MDWLWMALGVAVLTAIVGAVVWKGATGGPGPASLPGGPPLTNEFIGKCFDLGLDMARNGADFGAQVDAMAKAGCPRPMAYWFANLVPILAGRRFLASGPQPKLADHYVLVDSQGNPRAVRFAECAISLAVERRLDQLDPAEVVAFGMGSCEVMALNSILQQMGPQVGEDAVAKVRIDAPQMSG